VNEKMRALCRGAISPELRLYITIHWLARASYSDLQYLAGISKASVFRIIWDTIGAINQCNRLALQFPKNSMECAVLAQGFRNVCMPGAVDGCIGAFDGWLLKIHTPAKNAVGNIRSYFSGHYQCYRLNVQAICNHNSQFLYIAVLGPGVMCDNVAYKQKVKGASLHDLIKSLPAGYYMVADAAYTPTECLDPIVGGIEAQNPNTVHSIMLLANVASILRWNLVLCARNGAFSGDRAV